MYIEGVSSKEIYSKIKTQGYTGSESLIRKFITDFRSENIKRNEAVDIRYVERNDLISLLYKPI